MFKIVTDSTADLPVEYLKEHDLGCMNLSYIMDGVTYGQGQELPEKEFYGDWARCRLHPRSTLRRQRLILRNI